MPGLLSHGPADIVSRLLVALGAGTDPDASPLGAWPIYRNGEPPVPDAVITVYDTAGRQHGRTHTDGETQEHHGIQVRVRAATHPAGWAKANAIAVLLDGQYQSTVTISGTSYLVHAIHRTGDVIDLNKNVPADKRNIFTVNALVMVRIDI